MKKGGYQIVNLKDKNLSTSAVNIAGTHEAIEGNYRKPILLSGIVIGNVEKADAFVDFKTSGSGYSCVVYGYTILVAANDNVTATVVAQSN